MAMTFAESRILFNEYTYNNSKLVAANEQQTIKTYRQARIICEAELQEPEQ